MITKKAFTSLKKGDFLLTKSRVRPPKLREVLSDSKYNAVQLKGVYCSATVYTYSDLYRRVIGIWKIKNNIIMSKLIPMTDYVLSERNRKNSIVSYGALSFYKKVIEYATLLKKTLKLEMFIPCDEDGKPLGERPKPKELSKGVFNYTAQNIWDIKNKKAEQKLLFKNVDCKENSTIILITKDKNNKDFFIPITWLISDKERNWEFSKVEDLASFNLELINSI